MSSVTVPKLSSERTSELADSLTKIRTRIAKAADGRTPTLVAVSKYKPASDILACYDLGQRDFGENYVQELVDKARQLPDDIRWHFIGTLQSNKAKVLASIPNIHTIQTLSSVKAADGLNKHIPSTRTVPLNVLLQVNTSGEDAKSGREPLRLSDSPSSIASSELVAVAQHIVTACPRLHLHGLMTIGALVESLSGDENRDFEVLKETREVLERVLSEDKEATNWGEEVEGKKRLVLSMGMSSDFESALRAGADIVRVGTGIFGSRQLKGDTTPST
ncbi:hypothetical protein BV25DRAFT_1794951 [Artomyces pyxidatus]|uniref:Uncharacterized protein n=1 Tax=Artomyces pyxidatus TaxID=48021 RepID=A0ACB8TFN0_9AGAM|nr:hypothetical protein BV25DRAFT_1794951 [Artomyces pyxidatus]